MRELRQAGFARFCGTGFPTTHEGDSKFTNVSASAHTPLRPPARGAAMPSPKELEPYGVAGMACQLVFVNGRFAPALSLAGTLPEGVKVTTLAAQISANPEEL